MITILVTYAIVTLVGVIAITFCLAFLCKQTTVKGVIKGMKWLGIILFLLLVLNIGLIAGMA